MYMVIPTPAKRVAISGGNHGSPLEVDDDEIEEPAKKMARPVGSTKAKKAVKKNDSVSSLLLALESKQESKFDKLLEKMGSMEETMSNMNEYTKLLIMEKRLQIENRLKDT